VHTPATAARRHAGGGGGGGGASTARQRRPPRPESGRRGSLAVWRGAWRGRHWRRGCGWRATRLCCRRAIGAIRAVRSAAGLWGGGGWQGRSSGCHGRRRGVRAIHCGSCWRLIQRWRTQCGCGTQAYPFCLPAADAADAATVRPPATQRNATHANARRSGAATAATRQQRRCLCLQHRVDCHRGATNGDAAGQGDRRRHDGCNMHGRRGRRRACACRHAFGQRRQRVHGQRRKVL